MKGSVIARVLMIVPMLAVGLVLGGTSPATAAATCNGDISDRTIRGDLVVPEGADCDLTRVVVRGGVTVGANALLQLEDSEIRGPVTATGAASLRLFTSTVRGNVVSTAPDIFVSAIEVRGNLTITGGSLVAEIGVVDTIVRGDLTYSGNAGGFNRIGGNTVDGNLICEEQHPTAEQPRGAQRRWAGAKIGQCDGL